MKNMRTDTTTFAKFIYRAVRDLGINAVRSKIVASRIASSFRYGFYNPLGDFGFEARKNIETIELKLDITFSGFQCVNVIVDGEFAFNASNDRGLLVSIDPTPRQLELVDELHNRMRAANFAIGDACNAYAEIHGYPQTDAEFDARSDFCEQDPAVIAAKAAYDNLRDESLSLNPFAPGHIVDPRLAYKYSDTHKYEYGCRPHGYENVAGMREYLARPHRDFDDQFDEQIAA
jgi:hypothetical protein